MNHDEVALRFNRTFGISHQTAKIGGASEPLHVPAVAQQNFFAAEVRVQALESLFAAVIGVRFRVSADSVGTSSTAFAQDVASAVHQIESRGLSLRAHRFRMALLD